MYNKVLLKLSGESLSDAGNSIDIKKLNYYAQQIKEIRDLGVKIAIVIGGGNIFRGFDNADKGFERMQGDYMGMLATVINGLALQETLKQNKIPAVLLTAQEIESIGEKMIGQKALDLLEKDFVIIISGGTGNPFFTTDTAAALRALEIKANALLKGTRVDGVYSKDPELHTDAVLYKELTYDQVYENNLKVMDLTAFTLCKQNNLPIIVFNMNEAGNLKKVVLGGEIGTKIRANHTEEINKIK